jgi:flagellar hook-associated protein 1 FlgK
LEQDDRALNVFIGSGQTLVVGANATRLGAVATGPDLDQVDIVYQTPGGGATPITDLIAGGTLGGLINFRDEVLDAAQNGLGRIAVGLASSFNDQHTRGMDLEGNLGTDFFGQPQPRVYEATTNASSVSVALADAGQLTTEDYELRYDGAAWGLTRVSDGQAVTLSGTGTALDPFLADGISIVVSGAPAAGDYTLIRPTRLAAGQIDVAIGGVRQIAAAGAVYAESATANLGNAEISAPEVLDPSDANLLANVTIDFPTAGTYTINGGAPQAYTNGANIDVNGWRVQISGTPVAGDSFSLRSNSGGIGDNRNALALAGLQNTLTLEAGAGGPTASLQGAYESLVADVGTNTRAAQYNASAQDTLLQQAQAQRDSVSGVNLDEEAANLLRYQQAYQAAAQVISIAESLFRTLIDAVRR